jgi:calcineurin-like phosphoesterase family protein
MRGVIGGEEDVVEHLSQLLRGRRRIHVEHVIQRLGGRHVVCLGTHTADA